MLEPARRFAATFRDAVATLDGLLVAARGDESSDSCASDSTASAGEEHASEREVGELTQQAEKGASELTVETTPSTTSLSEVADNSGRETATLVRVTSAEHPAALDFHMFRFEEDVASDRARDESILTQPRPREYSSSSSAGDLFGSSPTLSPKSERKRSLLDEPLPTPAKRSSSPARSEQEDSASLLHHQLSLSMPAKLCISVPSQARSS